ncbi:hypothetical protein [Rufibacter sp. LB8]|uniref:hypothetical protein n=1 Tax=Rufibacter sp. LB8 TaxID=2777781 RepID=UPI00178C3F40|nr:hypothetical protein [Rufibacter sp. LB8]
MTFNSIKNLISCCLLVLTLSACSTANTPQDGTAPEESAAPRFRTLAPPRVDIRGTITSSRYDQGQVMLEVEGYGPTNQTRYSRAFVLVLPTLQILNPDGKSVSMNELRPGQDVAIMLRSGGQGNLIGVGVARKMWLEERL